MFFVYVLVSKVDLSTYVGFTSDLEARLKRHNAGETKSLKSKIPLVIAYYEAYRTQEMAIAREQELKKNRSAKERLFNRIFPNGPFV